MLSWIVRAGVAYRGAVTGRTEAVISEEAEGAAPRFEALGHLEFEETACPVCGATEIGKRLHKTFQGIDLHYGTCVRCGTLYTNPRLTVDSLRHIYATQEFFEGQEESLNYYSFLSGEEYLRRTARGRIQRFQKYTKGTRLLEVASAAGFFLAEAKAAGYEAEGIEISGPMAKYAAERWDVPVTAASIEETDLDPEAYDVIASWGVMTIIRDPKALIAKFHRALKPGGVWAFNTYYASSLWGRVFGGHWYILVANTSQIHHDPTLRRLADEAGFELVEKIHDRPYASIERLIFVLLQHSPNVIRNSFFEKIHFLNKLVVPARAPDAYEYVFLKH
jgi:SAM-dependent methyltransferase